MVLPNKKIYVILTNVCRLLLSLVLMLSGFVKAVDPIGAMYKMREYAVVFSMEGLSDDWLMFFAVMQAAVEFILGVFVLMGIYRKFTATATPVVMLFFTLLTTFIYFGDNVEDCGCFGEAVTMSNGETLLKNLFLLLLSSVFFFGRRLIVCYVSARSRWMVTIFSVFYIAAVQIISFNHLPVIDFGQYAVGTDLRSLTQGTPDRYSAVYVFERDGEQREFAEGEQPDSTWTFVSSKPLLVEEGSEPEIKGFVVYDWDNDYDATGDILMCEDHVCLVVIERVETASMSRVDKINDLYDHCLENGIPFYVTTASGAEEIELWRKRTGAEYPVYFSEEHVLRNIIRANPGLLILKDGVIVGKWNVSDLPAVETFAGTPDGLPAPDSVWVNAWRGWVFWMLMLALPLAVISLMDLVAARVVARRMRRKAVEGSAGPVQGQSGESEKSE